jgi:hypothetical protein
MNVAAFGFDIDNLEIYEFVRKCCVRFEEILLEFNIVENSTLLDLLILFKPSVMCPFFLIFSPCFISSNIVLRVKAYCFQLLALSVLLSVYV